MRLSIFKLNSINKKFLFATITVIVVLLGAAGTVLIVSSNSYVRALMESKGNSVANLALKMSKNNIENYDYAGLDELVEILSSDPEVEFTAIYNEDKTLLTKQKVPEGTEGLMLFERKIQDSDNKIIGYVTIGYSEKNLLKNLYRNIMFNVGLIIVLGALLGVFLSALLKKLIIDPIKNTNAMIKNLAEEGEGDLTVQINVLSDDELGELAGWLNMFIKKIATIVTEIKENAMSLSSAAEQMASSTEEMSSTTEEILKGITVQANAATESSSSMSTMDNSTNEINEKAIKLSDLYEITKKQAGSGEKALNDVINNISLMESDSEKINNIISVISEIASQTNLLALNAAIEAAKAGEQGKGFAVVAEEVRKLAERSATSTKEISDIINSNTQSIQTGVKLAGEAGESFGEIMNGINSTASFIKEITSITESQINTSSEVQKAIAELALTSENNSTQVQQLNLSTEEIAVSANRLAKISEDLNALISRFKIKND